VTNKRRKDGKGRKPGNSIAGARERRARKWRERQHNGRGKIERYHALLEGGRSSQEGEGKLDAFTKKRGSKPKRNVGLVPLREGRGGHWEGTFKIS